MAYVPEATHQVEVNTETGTDIALTAQLEREFRALQNSLEQITDFIRGAIPWKSFNLYLLGEGNVPPGAPLNPQPNPTLPSIFDSYNLDLDYGTDGVVHVSTGIYEFKLLIPIIGGIEVLSQTYPTITHSISIDNLPTTGQDTRVTLIEPINPLSGIFSIHVEWLDVPASGKGVWRDYDLRDNRPPEALQDIVWVTGSLNVSGRAASYGNTP